MWRPWRLNLPSDADEGIADEERRTKAARHRMSIARTKSILSRGVRPPADFVSCLRSGSPPAPVPGYWWYNAGNVLNIRVVCPPLARGLSNSRWRVARLEVPVVAAAGHCGRSQVSSEAGVCLPGQGINFHAPTHSSTRLLKHYELDSSPVTKSTVCIVAAEGVRDSSVCRRPVVPSRCCYTAVPTDLFLQAIFTASPMLKYPPHDCFVIVLVQFEGEGD